MEYSFSKNDYDRPQARLNMEAEAFGHWLSIEMSDQKLIDLQKIATAIEQLINRQLYEYEYEGREFYLTLNRQQAKVSANSTLLKTPESIGESCAYLSNSSSYDSADDEEMADEYSDEYEEQALNDNASGLKASCGLEDFQLMLLAWTEYIQN